MTRLRLTLSAGTGPREARRFVSRLAEALGHELAARGFQLDHQVVHGAALEPASIDLVGLGERQRLGDLLGTHALIERSAQRGKRARKRWFVSVALAALPASTEDVAALRVEDVSFETCRAGGAGGQHVNRTESAVRAVHRPSGLYVRVESSRSQQANRASALAHLAAALTCRAAQERARHQRDRRARALRVERGNPVAVWRAAGAALVRVDEKVATHA